ncbi:5617_t:CDS:2 [Funneliformis caledonium]|uniref:Carbonic anhydrase n=1 Tax=Funneliformis caledonium TaxID=1117310 RepID=A0A9N9H3W1_9GLOM|nr:5617_t:CDS:2 [Funneliformis caledonium]
MPENLVINWIGENLQRLLDNNKAWAKSITETEPEFFTTTAKAQHPKIAWFGCSDSRVPAETVVQLGPGEIFVHRNIANQLNHADLNSLSVLQYAVDHLKVEHIIVCGHYGCGGVLAAMSNDQHGLVDHWLRNIKDVYKNNKSTIESSAPEKRSNLLVELNVKQQVYNIAATNIVQSAWAAGRKLEIHGWAYRLDNGILNDLKVDIKGEKDLSDQIYKVLPVLPGNEESKRKRLKFSDNNNDELQAYCDFEVQVSLPDPEYENKINELMHLNKQLLSEINELKYFNKQLLSENERLKKKLDS